MSSSWTKAVLGKARSESGDVRVLWPRLSVLDCPWVSITSLCPSGSFCFVYNSSQTFFLTDSFFL